MVVVIVVAVVVVVVVVLNYYKNSKYYKLCTMSHNCKGRGTGVVGNPLGAWHLRGKQVSVCLRFKVKWNDAIENILLCTHCTGS